MELHLKRFQIRKMSPITDYRWEVVDSDTDTGRAIERAGAKSREVGTSVAIFQVWDSRVRKEVYRRGYLRR